MRIGKSAFAITNKLGPFVRRQIIELDTSSVTLVLLVCQRCRLLLAWIAVFVSTSREFRPQQTIGASLRMADRKYSDGRAEDLVRCSLLLTG